MHDSKKKLQQQQKETATGTLCGNVLFIIKCLTGIHLNAKIIFLLIQEIERNLILEQDYKLFIYSKKQNPKMSILSLFAQNGEILLLKSNNIFQT